MRIIGIISIVPILLMKYWEPSPSLSKLTLLASVGSKSRSSSTSSLISYKSKAAMVMTLMKNNWALAGKVILNKGIRMKSC